MPNAPKKRHRPWKPVRVQQQRAINMDWFYQDNRWRNFSKGFKKRFPLCVDCDSKGIAQPTKVTDHKTRYVDNGPGFDLDNLKDEYFSPMCASCHNSKSGRESHGYKGGMG